MFEQFIDTLKTMGYKLKDPCEQPTDLEHNEFAINVALNRRMVTLGSGMAGDPGAYAVFYFGIELGEFKNHGVMSPEEA